LVLEVSKKKRRGRFAAKIFRSTQESDAEKEYELARWAAHRQLGPQVMQIDFTCDTYPVIWMDLFPVTLASASQTDYAQAQAFWRNAIDLLQTGDFSRDDGSKRWLCGDDLKAQNIVFLSGQPDSVRLIDWDPSHWHSLPLSAREGCFLNTTFLLLNSALQAQNKRALQQLVGLWPESAGQRLLALCALAAQEDRVLRSALRVLSKLMRNGPFHYASPSSTRASQRVFLCRLEAIHMALSVERQTFTSVLTETRTVLQRICTLCKGEAFLTREPH
jgi:hypothetical protein